MSYHCSLQSFAIVGKPTRKFFLPPEYQQGVGPANLGELWEQIGQKPPGEWRLATKFYVGQLRGLDRTFGLAVAFQATRVLILLGDQRSFCIGHKDNFEKIEAERERPEPKAKESKPKVASVHEQLFAQFL